MFGTNVSLGRICGLQKRYLLILYPGDCAVVRENLNNSAQGLLEWDCLWSSYQDLSRKQLNTSEIICPCIKMIVLDNKSQNDWFSSD